MEVAEDLVGHLDKTFRDGEERSKELKRLGMDPEGPGFKDKMSELLLASRPDMYRLLARVRIYLHRKDYQNLFKEIGAHRDLWSRRGSTMTRPLDEDERLEKHDRLMNEVVDILKHGMTVDYDPIGAE